MDPSCRPAEARLAVHGQNATPLVIAGPLTVAPALSQGAIHRVQGQRNGTPGVDLGIDRVRRGERARQEKGEEEEEYGRTHHESGRMAEEDVGPGQVVGCGDGQEEREHPFLL